MRFNLNKRQQWFDTASAASSKQVADIAPYRFNYYLLAESLENIFSQLLSKLQYNEPESSQSLLYQPLSSRCVWISSTEEILIKKNAIYHGDWELCKAHSNRPKKPKLITFDMDSTLISEEVIDEIARNAGCYQQVAAVTEQAMRGELDFDQSLIKRVSLLKGLSIANLESIATSLNFSDGAEVLLNTLHQQKIDTAILSGGFDFFANKIARRLGITKVFSNKLEINSKHLSGKVMRPIVNAEMKSKVLISLAQEDDIELDSTMAVGDGANDLIVLSTAGLGIAWHAKAIVASQADVAINHLGLNAISWLWE